MAWPIPQDFVPRLRRDVKLKRLAGDRHAGVLKDLTFRTRYALDPAALRVVHAIDGRRNLARILEHVNRLGGDALEPEDLCRTVAMLSAATLLESPVGATGGAAGEGEPVVAWMAGTEAAPVEVAAERMRFLDGARFACQGTGMCCAGYDFVPVDDAVVEAVQGHRFSKPVRRRLGRDPFEDVTLDSGQTLRVIRQEDSRCVFLDDDRQCAIHKEIGLAAKPAVCRAFPLTFSLGANGDCFVSFSLECGGYATGRTCGAPLASRAEELATLLPRLPGIDRVPDPVPLADERTIPWTEYLELEQAWLTDLGASAVIPAASVVALCRRLVSGGAGRAAPPLPEDGARLWPRVADDRMRSLLERVLRHCTVAARRRFATRDVLAAELLVRVRIAAGLLLSLPAVVGDDLWTAARANFDPPPGTAAAPEVDALFLDQLRNAVFGKHLLRRLDLTTGLGIVALRFYLSSALAAIVAAHSGMPRVDAACVNEGIRTVHRCVRPHDLGWLDPSGAELARLVEVLGGGNA